MPTISQKVIQSYLDRGDKSKTTYDKGKALEDLICYLFEQVPGISTGTRNKLNTFKSEEIDIAFWNRLDADGFYFLPNIILVECKNWSKPVGSEEVNWFDERPRVADPQGVSGVRRKGTREFDSKLKRRGQSFGILVATNGITGDAQKIEAAHEIIRVALSEGRQLIVITRDEIEKFKNTEQLVKLL